jgi:hypothetical protein
MSDQLDRLQQLFARLCDGDWEHDVGITLENLDNPGWIIRIGLNGTPFETLEVDARKIERSEHDWVHISIVREAHDRTLQGACGPHNLKEMLDGVLDLLQ